MIKHKPRLDFPYDKVKQAKMQGKEPFYKSNLKYSKSQTIQFCSKCGDTSFELLDSNKPTGKCCRCGAPFG